MAKTYLDKTEDVKPASSSSGEGGNDASRFGACQRDERSPDLPHNFFNPNSRTLDPCSRHGVVYTIVNCLSTYLPCASRTSSLCTFCCQLRVAQTQILTRYAISLRAPTHLAVRKTRDRVKKPAKKVVKKAAAKKAPAKPRKTAAERRAEEMRWYRHHTSYEASYKDYYDDVYEEAKDRAGWY